MRYQRDLQVALRDRNRRLLDADYATSGHEIQLVAAWIAAQSTLRGILAEAERAEPDLDFDTWEKRLPVSQIFSWSSRTEEGRATLAWKLMQRIAKADSDTTRINDVVFNYATRIVSANSLGENRAFVQTVFSPLFDFLIERVGTESSTLYVIERYVRRIEWFDRDELHKRFLAVRQNGEDVYDRDLRRFLFGEGINMPFSQAKSASGLSDVLTDLDTDDPFIGEVKLFDAKDRGKRELATGVNQVTQYAEDWRKTAGYLIIINLSGRPLELSTDGPKQTWPPYLELGGIRVHLVAVRALPTPTASKQGKPQPVSITREDLINPDV